MPHNAAPDQGLHCLHLTHLGLALHKRDIGKQYRPISDAVWSGSTVHFLHYLQEFP